MKKMEKKQIKKTIEEKGYVSTLCSFKMSLERIERN